MKLIHSNAWRGAGKLKNSKGKGFLWFTSAQRRVNNKIDIQNENETT